MCVACGHVNNAATCDTDLTECAGTCVDTTTDPVNCGGCDQMCGSAQQCAASQCSNICAAPKMTCGDQCIDPATDPDHCGSCGMACKSDEMCTASTCQTIRAFTLTGTPDPTTVFNTIAETYNLPNNLVNATWNRIANVIVIGDFSLPGYWALPEAASSIAASPDHGTGIHAKLVQIATTDTVVYDTAASPNTGTTSVLSVATVDETTGLLSNDAAAVFGDAFAGNCSLLSASADELLCFDPATNTIRAYHTTAGSPMLAFDRLITLSAALPVAATCNAGSTCFGGTFAWDGAYYYFSANQSSMSNLSYIVYDATGTLVSTYTATGLGAINSCYFEWSVARYTTHDGFGARTGGTVYLPPGSAPDSQVYSAVSTNHVLMQ